MSIDRDINDVAEDVADLRKSVMALSSKLGEMRELVMLHYRLSRATAAFLLAKDRASQWKPTPNDPKTGAVLLRSDVEIDSDEDHTIIVRVAVQVYDPRIDSTDRAWGDRMKASCHFTPRFVLDDVDGSIMRSQLDEALNRVVKDRIAELAAGKAS